ncbi:hypothetical protein D1872_81640 [compost metagenome]
MSAKKTTAAKKEFKWDYEEHIGFVPVNERNQREVKRTTKNGKDYILLVEWKYFLKDGVEDWNAVKGFTIPAEIWDQVNDLAQITLEEHEPGSLIDLEEEEE